MRSQKEFRAMLVIMLAFCFSNALAGKDKETGRQLNPSYRIPGLAGRHLRAVGKRMTADGKEKTVYAGQLFDNHNNSTRARITHDVSGHVLLEGFRTGESLSFDGKRIKGSSDGRKVKGDAENRADEDLMEVFVMDNVEGMMEAMRNGAAVRFLGSGFRPDPGVNAEYEGPRYDIYEVTVAVPCRKDKKVRTRLYYFDTDTGLLLSTRYYDRSGNSMVKHETRFSIWGDIDGSKYPARVEHYVGDKLQFDFISESITNEKSADIAE